MKHRAVLFTLAFASALSAADGTLRRPLPVTDDLALIVSLAPVLRSGEINGIDDGVGPTFDLDLEGDGDVGPSVALRWSRGWWEADGWGWIAGAEGLTVAASGELEPKNSSFTQDLSIRVAALGPVAGIGWRADMESLELPGDALEAQILLHLRVGAGQAEIDQSGSGTGLALGAAVTAGLWWTGWHRWKVGAEVGGEWLQVSDVAWDNTGSSDFTFSGLTAGLGVGWRF